MWVPVTEADLLTKISGPELAAFRAAALDATQDDPVERTIQEVVGRIRGFIAACQNNRLGEDGTIPDKLVGVACDFITYELMSRAAGTIIDPNGAREKAVERGDRLMRDIAMCHFAVERPSVIDPEPIGFQRPTFSGRRPRYKWEEGL